ncbi:MAG: hypothetical protein HWD60_09355 [Defluviicoccus sp.]|nr:MAG: hypothetical protein HWD60_09355 [Defluviicoccus sp.]
MGGGTSLGVVCAAALSMGNPVRATTLKAVVAYKTCFITLSPFLIIETLVAFT